MQLYKGLKEKRKKKKLLRPESVLPSSEGTHNTSLLAAQRATQYHNQNIPPNPTLPPIPIATPLSLTPGPSTPSPSNLTPGDSNHRPLPALPDEIQELDSLPVSARPVIHENTKAGVSSGNHQVHQVATSPLTPIPNRKSSASAGGSSAIQRVPLGKWSELPNNSLKEKVSSNGKSTALATSPGKPKNNDDPDPSSSWFQTESTKPDKEDASNTSPASSPSNDTGINLDSYDSDVIKNSVKEVLEAIRENPKLRTHSEISLETAVEHFIQTLKDQNERLKETEKYSEQISAFEDEPGTVKQRLREYEESVSEHKIELERKATQIDELQTRISTLEREKDLKESNHQRYMAHIVREYRESESGLQEKLAEAKAENKALKRHHDVENEQLKQNLREIHAKDISKHKEAQHTHWETQQKRHQQELQGLKEQNKTARSQWQEYVDNLQADHSHKTQELNAEIAKIKYQWSEGTKELTAERAEERRRLTESHQSATEQLVRNYENELAMMRATQQNLEQKHDDFVTKLKEKFAQERQKMEKKHSDDLENLRQQFTQERNKADVKYGLEKKEYERMLQRLRDKLKNEQEEHQAEITEMEDQQKEELEKTEERHKDALEKMEERYKDEIGTLREQIQVVAAREDRVVEAKTKALKAQTEKLTRALVKRDHVKGLTDLQLGKLFKDLEILLEDFAQITWETSKEHQWPLSERALQQFRGGRTSTSLLKQHIVQSCFWAILYDHIFASPFEVFGDEGKIMLREWTSEFGEGKSHSIAPAWPEPSKESEKMRYEVIKERREGLKSRNVESQKQNICFERSLKSTVTDLTRRIQRVASLAEREQELLKEIVQKAAELWLETCCQRYRIVIVLPSANGNIFGSSKVKSSILKLIGKPEVRRIGNAQGTEFDNEEAAVQGWTGKPIMYEVQ